MKGQDETPERQLNEMEIGIFSEKEFRIIIVEIVQDLVKTMKDMQEMFSKDLEALCCAELLQSCPSLCNYMNCSSSGSSVHGILQARILEWIAISSSRGPSQLRD